MEDKNDFIFSWDKKQYKEDYIDLKDYSNFFKIKNFHDFSNIVPIKYDKYKKEEVRLKNWMRTFRGVPDEYFAINPIPKQIGPLYLSSFLDLIGTWHLQIRNKHIYNLWEEYYLSHRQSFDLIRNMEYDLKTSSGIKRVNLSFAENFRFKSEPNFLNLFNMRKEDRHCIIPQDENHFLYMIDFRQFEFRTFLNLTSSNIDFETEDLYGHIGKMLQIENPKIELISYLYSQRDDAHIKKVIDKNKIIDIMNDEWFFWKGYPVYFDKDSDYNKKIHSIIQTISYLIYLEKFSLVLEILKGKESRLVFPLHDAMIFSISGKEIELLEEIPNILVDDVYKIKQYIGKDFLNMEIL